MSILLLYMAREILVCLMSELDHTLGYVHGTALKHIMLQQTTQFDVLVSIMGGAAWSCPLSITQFYGQAI